MLHLVIAMNWSTFKCADKRRFDQPCDTLPNRIHKIKNYQLLLPVCLFYALRHQNPTTRNATIN